jgi:hypothetical protein
MGMVVTLIGERVGCALNTLSKVSFEASQSVLMGGVMLLLPFLLESGLLTQLSGVPLQDIKIQLKRRHFS